MFVRVTTMQDRLERGYGMRAQRVAEGLLLAATFLFDDLRPGYVAFAMLATQVIWPLACPVALLWALFDRRIPPDRLGNLYFDRSGVRGASFISCLALAAAFALGLLCAGITIMAYWRHSATYVAEGSDLGLLDAVPQRLGEWLFPRAGWLALASFCAFKTGLVLGLVSFVPFPAPAGTP